ncbi:S8 family serine peptidase [Candidatus Saccharibacteria bacterium]|nr:S8 family serine peptidase [candidate division Zixibacteria bacterium]NIT03925.1 S8 family serine peptidase [Candidatus Saccharibacteria bacterium]
MAVIKIQPTVRRDGTKEDEVVSFEAVTPSESGESMFAPGTFLSPENIEKFKPKAGSSELAAKKLQQLGFRILHVGEFSVSGEGTQRLWEKTFSTKVRKETIDYTGIKDLGQRSYLSHIPKTPFSVPKDLADLVERAYPQRPPTFHESPLPPTAPTYHYLNVPADVSMLLRADPVQKEGVTGKGVLVAMPDTGFYYHQFYKWRGYNYGRTLSPDAVDVELDNYGHGTAEAANIFSCAPDIDFVGVKMGSNATLAFKTAVDLSPAIVTNSWGYDLPGITELPNFLKPLEAEIIRAVKTLGITVVFSAGNCHVAFPAMMPEVIAAGGVYAHRKLSGDDFDMEATDYASSFISDIYPGRAVPDVCGLVGKKPKGIYIMLPVQPKCSIDQGLGGSGFPNKDETETDDGWAVISGTSAAAPQVAGVCALLKQIQPSLSPGLIKNVLSASARDVKKGQSCMGDKAGRGFDSATGAGLVDAYAAYRIARSIQVRPLFTLPAPR